MSDLYLELKSRIPVVAMRTHIGTSRLQEAQDAVGLSNERLARLVPVSEKTWRRWKEAGEVPTYALPKVAEVLRLELVEAPRPALELAPTDRVALREELEGALADLLDGQAEMLIRQEKILARLEALEAALDAPAARRRAARGRRD